MVAPFHYDRNRLKDWIEDESIDSSGEIASHVETCDACQTTMESLFQDGLSMEVTGTLLREGLVDRGRREVDNGGLELLESSDHPGALGCFARYEVMEFLGRGGMGIVMRAFDPLLDRHCAVKVLAPELASNAAARKRFSREAKSAAAVVHPHVVPIQTVDEHNGLPYLVMPVVDGQSLQQRVESGGPLSIIETVRIAAQVADGLAAAHAQGLVHRDIKPANILLENGVERVQITDFGLARAIDDASMTRSGVIAGTPQYMSPEQAHGDAIDHRSDLFSLGSVMYFMLTGRSPFRAETTMGVLNRIGNDQPRSLRSINAGVPEWLEAIVMKLLSKSRDERFESAEQVAKLLGGCLAHVQEPATTSLPINTPSFNGQPQATPNRESSRLRLGVKRFSAPPIRRLIATAAFAFFAIAGTIIYIETGKGTLRIESNSDADVPIVVKQGDNAVEHLTVSKEGTTTRLKAGKYILQIDDVDSEFVITDGQVVLKRGGQWLARIAESPRESHKMHEHASSHGVYPDGNDGWQRIDASDAQNPSYAPSNLRSLPSEPIRSQSLIGAWRLLRWLNAGRDTGTEVDSDSSVMKVDDSYITVSTENVSPDERYFYRLLPGDVLHLIETGESGGTETKAEYSFTNPNLLRLEYLDSDRDDSVIGSEWQRIAETPQPKAPVQDSSGNRVLSNPPIPQPHGGAERVFNGAGTATQPQGLQSGIEPRGALLLKSNVPKLRQGEELHPNLDAIITVDLSSDAGIDWLFNEDPVKREPLPFPFNVDNVSGGANIPFIDSSNNVIASSTRMQCADASEDFWDRIKGQKVKLHISQEDFDTVVAGNKVTKVVYLPDGETTSLDTLVSTRVDPGIDVLEEANRRGQAVVSIRLSPHPEGAFSLLPMSSLASELPVLRCPSPEALMQQVMICERTNDWAGLISVFEDSLLRMIILDTLEDALLNDLSGSPSDWTPAQKALAAIIESQLRNGATEMSLMEYYAIVRVWSRTTWRGDMKQQYKEMTNLILSAIPTPRRCLAQIATWQQINRNEFLAPKQYRIFQSPESSSGKVTAMSEAGDYAYLLECNAQGDWLIKNQWNTEEQIGIDARFHDWPGQFPRKEGDKGQPIALEPHHSAQQVPQQPESDIRENPRPDGKSVSEDRKTLSVRLHGDKELLLADPTKPDSHPQQFTANGIVLPFSLEKPGEEACFHIVDRNFQSIRAVVRLECSEFLPESYWERLGEQPIELSVSRDDFTGVLLGNLTDRVVYLPAENAGDLLQTKSYGGIGRPNDVVEDARELGGQPLVSIRLDPPTAADKAAKSHKRVGPTFNSGRSNADFFNRCSDEELLRALQGSWIQTQFSHNGEKPEEYPTTVNGKPLRLVFDGTTFHWNALDMKTNTPTRETFTLVLNGPRMPRLFSLIDNESYDENGLPGILQLKPDGELTLCFGRDLPRSFKAEDHFLIKAHRSHEGDSVQSLNNGTKPAQHDHSLATPPVRSLNLIGIDESRRLIEVSQGRDSGIELGHYIFSDSVFGGSCAEVIEVKNDSAIARMIAVDSELPFRKGAIVYAFSNKSDQPTQTYSGETSSASGSVKIEVGDDNGTFQYSLR